MKLCKDKAILKRLIGGEMIRAWGEIDGYTYKPDRNGATVSVLNQASRALTRAMRPCYLVKVNRYDKDTPHIEEYRKGMVFNFQASFAIPVNDPELLRLLEERDTAEYTGTSADSVRVDAIYKQMGELGGEILSWC
jgi:hypothetical protein